MILCHLLKGTRFELDSDTWYCKKNYYTTIKKFTTYEETLNEAKRNIKKQIAKDFKKINLWTRIDFDIRLIKTEWKD